MGSIDTPRLYRKFCGTYYLRVILEEASSKSGSGRKRAEVRRSLRTKNPAIARSIAAWANALLERHCMTDRRERWNAIDAEMRQWTYNNGQLTVDGPDDQRRFNEMLAMFPELRQGFAEGLRGGSGAMSDIARQMHETIARTVKELKDAEAQRVEQYREAQGTDSSAPSNPMAMSSAIARFNESKKSGDELSPRTMRDRHRLLRQVVQFVGEKNPALGPDPFVHDVRTHHVSAFLDVRASGDEAEVGKPLAAKTMLKCISDLRAFFAFAQEELQATRENPMTGLNRRGRSLRKKATKEERHYPPFTSGQLATIFEPEPYLAFNRAADYFWVPLIGLHLGTRLKEVITLELDSVSRDKATGLWYLDIEIENAKNANSIRRLPLPAGLLELGFVDYIERLRSWGCTNLFPHRDMTGTTAKNDPSKNCSRHFGLYIDTRAAIQDDKHELRKSGVVFHSFRHTMVTALHDCGTPVPDAMQITGHQAQDHAIRSNEMKAGEANSVHLGVYSHADAPRMNVDHPLERVKSHLDRAMQGAPLDYPKLRKAAEIVLEHTLKTKTGVESGWHTNRHEYTVEQVSRLRGCQPVA